MFIATRARFYLPKLPEVLLEMPIGCATCSISQNAPFVLTLSSPAKSSKCWQVDAIVVAQPTSILVVSGLTLEPSIFQGF